MNGLLQTRGSVRRRLTLWNVGVLALTLIVLGAALLYTLRITLISGVDRSLGRFAQNVQHEIVDPHWIPPPRRADGSGAVGRYSPRLLNLQGQPIPPFPPGPAWDPATFLTTISGRDTYSTIQMNSEPLRVLSVPIRHEGRIVGVMQVVHSLSDEYLEIRRLTNALLALIPLALLIAGAGGAFLTGRALRPVRQITQAAGRIEAHDLSDRLSVAGNDEFADLAATFNGMLGRLEEAFIRREESFTRLTQAYEQQRRFTADASHEMRTPLTIIKAQTSLALLESHTQEDQESLEAIDRAADRTIRLVQDLLLLARSDAGQLRLSLTACSLQDILEQAPAAVMGAAAPISLELPATPLVVCGNADALTRLFSNLLTNAARHTPVEGQIIVRAENAGPLARVRVGDSGEGIPPEHLPHIGERFYRVDAARSEEAGGSGLGLAICRSIAEAHGGSLTVESAVGLGTTVSVFLPRAG